MAKLHIVVAAYNSPISLRSLIDQFILQTNPNWGMTVIHDGPASDAIHKTIALYENEPRINFIETEQRIGNWGISNRRAMLQMITGEPGDFILNTNDDNGYVPVFVEYMLKEAQSSHNKAGLVFCDFLHHNFDYDVMDAQILLNHIDAGAYIVDLGVAQSVGMNHDSPGWDGLFAEECAERCRQLRYRVVHVAKVLFIHN